VVACLANTSNSSNRNNNNIIISICSIERNNDAADELTVTGDYD